MAGKNLLFVFGDQHRFCDLGCYGNSIVRTPNLDRMAEEGVLMERMYSNCPVCVPARGTLLTGLYPFKHRALTNDLPIDPSVPSIAHRLEAMGYDTGYVGKWHLGGIPRDRMIPPEERLGFRHWRGCNCNHDYYNAWYDDTEGNRHTIDGYEPFAQTRLAREYIRDAGEGEKPWALFLSYGTPHEPYELVPEEYKALYPDPIPFRENVRLPAVLTLRRDIQRPELEQWYRDYYAHITALDDQMGALMQELERTGQKENTLVIYTSDHGDMLGSQGETNKQLPYEEAAHIPFLLSGPGVIPGRRSQLMSLVDLVPTLMGLLGGDTGGTDGADLSRVFSDPAAPGNDSVYLAEYVPCHQAVDRGDVEWRAVRDQRFLYAKSPSASEVLLFDLDADPLQLRNLAADPDFSEELRRMDHLLNQWIDRVDRFLPWDDILQEYGLVEEWNRSQAWFHRPLLDENNTKEKCASGEKRL